MTNVEFRTRLEAAVEMQKAASAELNKVLVELSESDIEMFSDLCEKAEEFLMGRIFDANVEMDCHDFIDALDELDGRR